LFVSAGLLLPLLTAQAQQTDQSPSNQGQEVMAGEEVTNIPYFSISGETSSILTLNNNKNIETQVTVTVFDSSGNPIAIPPITLQPGSITDLSLKDLLKGANIDSGNISISYDGAPMSVTAQVGVFDAGKRVSFESREADMMDSVTSEVNALVWFPDAKCQAFLALTNVSALPVRVEYSLGSKPEEVILKPRQTQLLHLNQYVELSEARAVLLRLKHYGKPGAIISTGFVLNKVTGYSSSFVVVDPGTSRSTHLAGAGARFGIPRNDEGFPSGTSFSAPLIVANVGTKPVSAKVTVDYTLDSVFAALGVEELRLDPGEIKQVDLAERMKDLGVGGSVTDAGVDIDYRGDRGSLIGSLTCVDQAGDFSFDVPIKDPADTTNTRGNSYPWTLDDGTKTTLHIKNATDKAQHAKVLIRYAGGNYIPDVIELQPYQTAALDIQKLKASQARDVRGQVFALAAMNGTVLWSEDVPNTLIGRAEEFNLGKGITRSFSCGGCQCGLSFDHALMSPSSYTGPISEQGFLLQPQQVEHDCNGYFYGPYNENSITSWYSSNYTVVSVTQTGTEKCLREPLSNHQL
jgi:hypothetical protein